MLRDPANLDSWAEVIDTWSGAFVAYGDYLLTVLTRNGKAFNIELPSLDGAIVKVCRTPCYRNVNSAVARTGESHLLLRLGDKGQ